MLLNLNRDDAKFNEEPLLSTNLIDIEIQNFDGDPSVKLIRDTINLSDMFQFESVSLDGISSNKWIHLAHFYTIPC